MAQFYLVLAFMILALVAAYPRIAGWVFVLTLLRIAVRIGRGRYY